MQKLDQFFIDGRWVKAMGEGRHPVVDPATEEVYRPYRDGKCF